MNSVSVVIPTVNYSPYLDIAIESCTKLKHVRPNVYVNINNECCKAYRNSKFWGDDLVKWRKIKEVTLYQRESINDAIHNSEGKWLFILSDDDVIGENFLGGIDLDKFADDELYMTITDIIDANGVTKDLSKLTEYSGQKYGKSEAMRLFFSGKLHNHLSMLVFSRSMFSVAGPMCFTGYPNGYYLDTIFHGKAFANCSSVTVANVTDFYRRESVFQGSSKFYFDRVDGYFDIITKEFLNDPSFKNEALRMFGTELEFKRNLLRQRVVIEWSKLNNPIYDVDFRQKIRFLVAQLKWKTGIGFKFIAVLIFILFPLRDKLPAWMKNTVKSLIK